MGGSHVSGGVVGVSVSRGAKDDTLTAENPSKRRRVLTERFQGDGETLGLVSRSGTSSSGITTNESPQLSGNTTTSSRVQWAGDRDVSEAAYRVVLRRLIETFSHKMSKSEVGTKLASSYSNVGNFLSGTLRLQPSSRVVALSLRWLLEEGLLHTPPEASQVSVAGGQEPPASASAAGEQAAAAASTLCDPKCKSYKELWSLIEGGFQACLPCIRSHETANNMPPLKIPHLPTSSSTSNASSATHPLPCNSSNTTTKSGGLGGAPPSPPDPPVAPEQRGTAGSSGSSPPPSLCWLGLYEVSWESLEENTAAAGGGVGAEKGEEEEAVEKVTTSTTSRSRGKQKSAPLSVALYPHPST